MPAVAPPSSPFHQIAPPKCLDLKHSGEVTENGKLWKEKYNNIFVISRLDLFFYLSVNPGVSVGDVQTFTPTSISTFNHLSFATDTTAPNWKSRCSLLLLKH